MKHVRLWAYGWLSVAALSLLCLSSLSVAEPTGAQTELPTLKEFGEAPYDGPDETGCKLLHDKIKLSLSECKVGQIKLRRGLCREYFIQDGEIITTTFTRANGAHDVATVVVDLDDENGKPLPPDHKSRKSLTCATGNKDGLAVLMPDGCPNWSAHVPKPVVTTRRTSRSSRIAITGGPVAPSNRQYLSGFQLRNCKGSLSMPGMITGQESTLKSTPFGGNR